MKTRWATSRHTRLALLLLTLWIVTASLAAVPASGQECCGVWILEEYYWGYQPYGYYLGYCFTDCQGNRVCEPAGADYYHSYSEMYWGCCETCS